MAKVKEVVGKYLHLDDDRIIDVIFATHLTNQMCADPVWLIIIDAPSNAKTEILRGLSSHEDFYFLSTLTPATFISGKNTKNKSASKIFEMDGKTLVFKDFTTILSMRAEPKAEILAQFREIYDGFYSKATGNGPTITWEGKIGFIAACTPIYDRHYGVIGSMGDRFLLYRGPNNNAEKITLMAQKNVGKEDEMRNEINKAFSKFLSQFNGTGAMQFNHNKVIDPKIRSLACFCAVARTPVERNPYTRTIDYVPQPEGPARLVKQLTQMGMGLAMVHAKTRIDVETYKTIRKIGCDLVPTIKFLILKHLWKKQSIQGEVLTQTTSQVAAGINVPTNTAKSHLEDLMVVGALHRQREEFSEKAPYEWQITNMVADYIEQADIFRKTWKKSIKNNDIPKKIVHIKKRKNAKIF